MVRGSSDFQPGSLYQILMTLNPGLDEHCVVTSSHCSQKDTKFLNYPIAVYLYKFGALKV